MCTLKIDKSLYTGGRHLRYASMVSILKETQIVAISDLHLTSGRVDYFLQSVREKQRERETIQREERERQSPRETETHRDRKTETDRDKERDREKEPLRRSDSCVLLTLKMK